MIYSIQALWLGSTWDPPDPMPNTGPYALRMTEDWSDSATSYSETAFFDGISSIDIEPHRFRRMAMSWRRVQ